MSKPKLVKIVVNMGTGELLKNKEATAKVEKDLAAITGQKPKITHAKKSIAGFNIREGQPVGMVVTLRDKKMNDFLKKLTSVVLPRLRDFRGVPKKGFDRNGNYTLGVSEHTVFPEIDLATIDKARGMEITIVTTARTPERGYEFLKSLGMPFEKPVEGEAKETK